MGRGKKVFTENGVTWHIDADSDYVFEPPLNHVIGVNIRATPTAQTKSFVRRALGFILSPISRCIRQRFSNCSAATVTLFSIATSLPPVIFGAMIPSGDQPKDIGEAWWNSMSPALQCGSIIVGTLTLVTLIRLNEKQFPSTCKHLKNNFPLICSSPTAFLKHMILLLLAGYSALAGAGIGYKSLLWTQQIAAAFFAFFNLFVIFSRRYPSLNQLFEDIKNIFKSDVRFQRTVVAQLKKMKPEFRNQFDLFFANIPITEESAYQFLEKIFNNAVTAASMPAASLFDNPSELEKIGSIVLKTFKLSTAIYMGSVALPINAQNGFDGANMISTLIFDKPLDPLDIGSKRALGFVPGWTAMIFVYDTTMKSFDHFEEMLPHLQTNPRLIPTALLSIAMDAVATISNGVIAKGVISTPDNITGLTSSSKLSPMIINSNGVAGFFPLFNASANHFKKAPNTPTEKLIHFLESHELKEINRVRQYPYFMPTPQSHPSSIQLEESKQSDVNRALTSISMH